MRRRSRSRGAPALHLLLALFLLLFLFVTDAEEDLPTDKLDGLPEKGDGECKTLVDRFQEGFGWYTSCDDEPEEQAPEIEVPDHGFTLQLYSSLPAYAPDFGKEYIHVLL